MSAARFLCCMVSCCTFLMLHTYHMVKPTVALDAIGIVSSDINRSIEFFSLLRIEFMPTMSDEASHDHMEATLPNGLRLMLDSEKLVRQLNPNWNWPSPNTQTTLLAFSCDCAQGVDDLFDSITGAGFTAVAAP